MLYNLVESTLALVDMNNYDYKIKEECRRDKGKNKYALGTIRKI